MRNRSSLDPIVWSSFGLLILVFTVLGFVLVQQFTDENTKLKVQVVEWQRAALPAIRARGWANELQVEKLIPRDLAEALDPCIPVATTVSRNEATYRPTACQIADGSVPIKIELAYPARWPQ